MPTENRSSNTELISQAASAIEDLLANGTGAIAAAAWASLPADLRKLTAQPHPDPIAWMVGTAFWWTKEEAERDAAAMGLPIVGLGPMAGVAPADQHQSDPVALPAAMHSHDFDNLPEAHCDGWNACLDEIAKLGPLYAHPAPVRGEPVAWCQPHWSGKYADYCWGPERPNSPCPELWKPLYTHTDPAEVERLRADIETMRRKNNEYWHETEALRAQLAETEADRKRLRDNNVELTMSAGESQSQLAEAHALLREIHDGTISGYQRWSKIEDLLNASAEPKCGKCHGRGLLRIATVCGPADKSCPECASAEPSAPVDATHYYPEAAPGRQWRKKVGGLWCEFCGGKWLPLDVQDMSHGYVAIEPSAPVEINERAEFEKAVIDKAERFHPDLRRYGDQPEAEYRDANNEWAWGLWQACAALERKPS